jgi:indole-3-glycerol phosphate synthase
MAEFDVSRIVPSTRNFTHAVSTRRKSLALIPLVEPGATSADEAARLDGLDVRGLAMAVADRFTTAVAQATGSLPCLCLAPLVEADGCQRARFYGADAVCIDASDEEAWTRLSKAGQSMHMTALARVHDEVSLEHVARWDARVVLLEGDTALLQRASEACPKAALVAAAPIDDADALRALAGVIDAAVVAPALHQTATFEQLLDELDG